MAAPQGLFQFAGAQALFSGSFTLATGISPSVCTLSVAPGARSLRIGPLVLSYGGVRMVWRDCIVDKVEASIGEDGFTTWQLSILDRRWKWRGLGKISGKYNTRVGGTIDDTTRKSARQLVDLCLKELRERNAVTAEVPTDIFPEVEWDYEPPAEALAKLCDELGLVVVLDVTDRVRVMRKGSGPPLPNLPSVVAYEALVDPPELPSEIVIVGGPTRYVGFVALVAVGLEADGTIKPIDELSYKPADGWGSVDLRSFYSVAEESRALAQQTVFKWYRVIDTVTGLPGRKDPVARELLLPLDPDEAETIVDVETGRTEKRSSEVKGVFYNGTDAFGVFYDDAETPPEADDFQSLYSDSYDIDTERGIVKFPQAMYQLYIGSSRTGGSGIAPADLWLKIGLSLRDPETRAIERYEFRGSRKTGSPTPARYVVRDDLVRVRTIGEGGEWTDNLDTLKPQAAAIRRQIEAEYKVETPVAASYDGIVPISPSGAVPSVSWTIADSGRASTRASIHFEDLTQPVPSRAESRFAERARAENARKKLARAERDRIRRGG